MYICPPLVQTQTGILALTFFILAAVFTLSGGEALAECINPADTIVVDGVQTRFECDAGEDIDITLDLDGFTISTTMDRNLRHGIQGSSIENTGITSDITINVRDGSVMTFGTYANGVDARHPGEVSSGKNSIIVNNLTISTQGSGSNGVYSLHQGRGINGIDNYIDIDVQGSIFTTQADEATGIFGRHEGIGDIYIDVQDSMLSTTGDFAHGIYGLRNPLHDRGDIDGDVNITVQGGSIITQGKVAHGIYGRHAGNLAIRTFDADDNHLVVSGYATGSINIITRGVTITTESTALDPDFNDTFSHGIYGRHQGTDNINIEIRDRTDITTKGVNSHGIYGRHQGTGNTTITINGSSITASGEGSSGVRVESAAEADDEGYRKQTVRVNGAVYGGTGMAAAGVFLENGGRVYIAPQSRVGAQSGIAVLATGDSGALNPKLLVNLMTGSLRIEEILGENWIINDGGETTIVVNGTVLHDDATGVTRLWAPYGARDVTLREEGVTIDNRTDPNNWVFSSTTAAADRDFSAADFITGAYGPRAAVYEALPSAILQMDGRGGGSAGERLRSKESPLWIRLIGSKGSYEMDRSTVGVDYNFDRFEVEAGMDFQFGEGLTSSAGVRLVTGSTDVSSPTRGGRINAQGEGLSFGLAWEGAKGFYGEGRAVATLYNTNLSSETRGQLKNNVNVIAHALSIEAGRRFALTERTLLTARAWVNQTGVSIDRFTDRIGTRVTPTDKDQLNAGVSGTFETDLPWNSNKGKLSLRGTLGVEQMFSDGEADVLVSGENLKSKAPDDARLLLDLGTTYRQDRYMLRGAIQAHGLGSKANEYATRIELRTAF